MFVSGVKNIGFLSFGHWTDHPDSGTRTASDALLQAIDLAVAAAHVLGESGEDLYGCFVKDYKPSPW